MPRYYFDIHAGSLSEWDDDGIDAADADAAIAHAKSLIAVVIGDITRLGGDRHAVVTVRNGSGRLIATVTGMGSGEAQVSTPDGG